MKVLIRKFHGQTVAFLAQSGGRIVSARSEPLGSFVFGLIPMLLVMIVALAALTMFAHGNLHLASTHLGLIGSAFVGQLKTAKDLRAERASMWEQSKAIVDKAEGENRDLSAEEKVSFDKIGADMDAIKTRYERIEKNDETEKELAESQGKRTVEHADGQQNLSADEKEARKVRYFEAFRKWMIGGEAEISPEDRSLLRERRAQSVAVDSGGGYTVPTELSSELEKAQLAFGGMRQVSRIITTTTGNDLSLLNSDDTSNEGEILAENTTVNNQDVSFSLLTFNAWKYSSKMVPVSVELLQDSILNIAQELGGLLGERLGRVQNKHYSIGDGASKPQGIVPAATAGVTCASASAITSDELIDWEHSVDPAYRPGAQWMMHDTTIQKIRKLKNTVTGDYMWQPGLKTGSPDLLLGYPVIINQSIAVIAASAKVGVFGQLSKYIIRDVAGYRLVRLNERFADSDQVAFLAFQRSDGDLRDAGTHPVKTLIMHA